MPKNKKKNLLILLIHSFTFLLAIADGIAGYTQSSFLSGIIGAKYIGLALLAATSITLLISFKYPKFVASINNFKAGFFTLFTLIAATTCLIISHNPYILIPAFIIRYVGLILLVVNFDIFLESQSDDKHTGRIRSEYLTVINFAWLLSPILAGWLASKGGYSAPYTFSFWALIILFVFYISSYAKLKKIKIERPREINLKATLKAIKAKTSLKLIYASAIILQIFFSFFVFYIPIRLNSELGFSWAKIGLIFTVMLLPFVLMQFPAGILADKIGEKKMLIAGNIIMAAICLIVWGLSSTSVIVWMIVLFLSRTGAALAEAMQEIFFYKNISASDFGLINLFRETKTIGWLLGSALSFIILSFTTITNLFPFLALIIIIQTICLKKLKDKR